MDRKIFIAAPPPKKQKMNKKGSINIAHEVETVNNIV